MHINARCAAAAMLLSMLATNGSLAELERAALLRTGFTGEDTGLLGALSAQLVQAGYQVTEIGTEELCDQAKLVEFDLLMMPDGSSLPAAAMRALQAYLQAGSDLIALNTPLWQKALIKADGGWITREEYELRHVAELPEHAVINFAPGSTSLWERGTNAPKVNSRYESSADGPGPGQYALHAVIPKLASWDTFGTRKISAAFRDGDTLTVFSAKGGAGTTQLAVEWTETDGSRWIAVIPLSTEWRRYVLRPQDFKFWESVPQRQGDSFRPENAVGLHIGLALTHTRAVGSGPHEFWVGPIGTAKATAEVEEILELLDPPILDTLSPGYKLFDCSGVAGLTLRKDQAFDGPVMLDVPRIVRSPHPRAGGGGFDKGRDWRWIGLVEAVSAKGEWSGTPATLTVNAAGPCKGGVWASFGIADEAWYRSEGAQRLIGQTASRMRRGVFIVDGGSNFYTYFEGQPVELGVRAVNTGRRDGMNLVARVTVSDAGRTVALREWPLSIAAGEETTVRDTWHPKRWPKSGYQVKAEIVSSGGVIDRVTHDVFVYTPATEKHFITVKDGQFVLDGKRWRMHGINYMPSSGLATDDWRYFERWMDARAYDPEVVQRDLDCVKDIGFNAVSVFIYEGSTSAQNLLDLLRRLDSMEMKANLSLRPGTISDFGWDKTRPVIEYYRLWENDTVMAYDLDWEPMFRGYEDRKQWDSDWKKWIVERYGSVESAERDWSCKAPEDASGALTNPPPHYFGENADLSGARMVAAYRRFLDTLLYKKYSAWRRLVRELDPNHLISFRMAEAGNPTLHGSWIPFDFPYLAGAVDFLAPEAYGRAGDWERVKPGWFVFEYARWAAPNKPMIWAEHGISTWDMARMANSHDALANAAKNYDSFYRMLVGSGASGVAHWWYPGGFRLGEKSDFGIVNPDGTDRPVTKVIRKWAAGFLNGPSAKPVDHWISFDRDAHPDGISSAYDAVKREFWNAIKSGDTPGLRTDGTGTDSTNCPLVAVGNTPCNGSNPPKYLDAVFDAVEVTERTARVTLTNLGEATWSPTPGSDGKGAVYLIFGDTKVPIPSRVPRFGSVTMEVRMPHTEVTLSLEAEGRARFGEKRAINAASGP